MVWEIILYLFLLSGFYIFMMLSERVRGLDLKSKLLISLVGPLVILLVVVFGVFLLGLVLVLILFGFLVWLVGGKR